MRRELPGGFELDDDRSRVDVAEVHRYLTSESYWAERGLGLGFELVREAVANGPHAGLRWLLHTRDAHTLYAKFGFGPRPRR